MIDRVKVVHDLALIHAEAKYREFLDSVSPENRPFQSDIKELAGFYEYAVTCLVNHIDGIESAYKDDDGIPYFGATDFDKD